MSLLLGFWSAATAGSLLDVKWSPYALKNAPLTVLVPAPPSETMWPVGEALQAGLDIVTPAHNGIPEDRESAISVVVRVGEGVGMEELQRDYARWSQLPVAQTTVCGRPARRFEATVPEEHITCVIDPVRGNHPDFVPARTIVGVVFEHAGLPATVTWTVQTDTREALRSAEERFFNGIVCR